LPGCADGKKKKKTDSNRVMPDSYQSDFEAYLACTDEKEILLREIRRDFHRQKVKTVLDIGAGNGKLSIPLSKEFSYLAVEKKPEFVKSLTKNGVSVIEGLFPIPIEEKFDAVLISHSLNVYRESFETFVSAA
jgi:SAM-dependent methyltransferase